MRGLTTSDDDGRVIGDEVDDDRNGAHR